MLFALIMSWLFLPANGTLQIQVQNIQSTAGVLRIALFNRSEGFLEDENAVMAQELDIKQKGSMYFQLPDLPFGKYALAIYHDLNNNKKLDTNAFGVPKEPYAFSNNARAKWSSPTFDESAFQFKNDQQTEKVTLQKWRKQ